MGIIINNPRFSGNKQKVRRITTPEMELAVATYINIRQNLVVPNVYCRFTNHECDLFVITKSGYAWEIEIKISKADLKRDKEKRHGHYSDKIKYLYFAIPEKLLKDINLIPERAGVIVVEHTNDDYFYCKKIRNPKENSKYKLNDKERYEIARLGAMRIWGLKVKLNGSQNKK